MIPLCERRFVTIPVAELTIVLAAFGRFRRADTSGFVPNEVILARLIGGGNRMTSDHYMPGMFRSTRFPNLFHMGSLTTMTSSSSPKSRLRIHTGALEAVAAGQLDGGIVV